MKIDSVTKTDSGWTIEAKSSGFHLAREAMGSDIAYDIEPKIGDDVEVHTELGSRVVGVTLNGQLLYMKSREELDAEHALYVASYDRKKREVYEREKGKLNEQYESLPQVFKDRIERFRKNNPDFSTNYESYEMFSCTEAVKIAEVAFKSVDKHLHDDEVDAFWSDSEKLSLASYPNDEPWTEPENKYLRWLLWAWAIHSKAFDYDYARHRELTGLSDGHSGNTAGMALSLARLYIESPEYVSKMHGALSTLVGSEEYGDIDS